MTNLNRRILDMIQNSDGHLSASEAFDLARSQGIDVSLSSMYRILNSLYEKGYISKFITEDKIEVYDKTLNEHGHMICEKCGKTIDVNIKNFKKILSKELKCDVTAYKLTASYICPSCKEN